MELPLGSGYYVSESPAIATLECENYYVNIPEAQAISDAQLFPTPGILEIEDTGDDEVNRGSHTLASKDYKVNGNKLYRIDRTINALGNNVYARVGLGTIIGDNRVSMDDNGTQLCIVVPGTATAYIYTVSGGLVTITDPAFIPFPATIVNQVRFVDGYFVFAADESRFFHSNLNDGTAYTATDFGIYSDSRNDIVGIHVHKEQLYVFGKTSSKAYANIGGIGFIFQEIDGYTFSKGLASQHTLIELDGTFAMMGQGENESPKIYIFTGNDFVPISHTGIEHILHEYNDTDISESFALSYAANGATFGIWSLKNNTFCYESKASQLSQLSQKKVWHTRNSINLQGKNRWRVNSISSVYGTLVCGDSEGGKIGELNLSHLTEYDNNIVRKFSLPTIEANGQMIAHEKMELIINSGQGLNGGEAKCSLEYTDDGINYKGIRQISAGALGQRERRLIAMNLGSTSRFRIYRYIFSDPVKWVIQKCLWNEYG